MRIQNNVSAHIALRNLTANRSALTKSLEKLASGYAVNRAGDDAAGLAISEKMRRQITGLDQSLKNSKAGSNLIQTGEGALAEIHDMLNRATVLAEQSANGTYDNELDRRVLQRELDQLCADISRIAEGANFNGIKLFQNKGLEYEGKNAYAAALMEMAARAAAENSMSAASPARTAAGSAQAVRSPRTLDGLLEGQEKGDLNIVYIEHPMTAVNQQPDNTYMGGTDLSLDKTVDGKKLSEILKTQIVPQTVQNILKNYSAFSYLKDSAIGIGLQLFSEKKSNVMAVAGYSPRVYADGTGSLGFSLGVNMALVDTTKANWREELEATIAHELIHTFMEESITSGMSGYFPALPGSDQLRWEPTLESWFFEGMAQTANGALGWFGPNAMLDISADSTDDEIKQMLNQYRLNSGTGVPEYGTGYLACMYLGWTIAGGGDVTAKNISKGLNALLSELIGGSSLDAAIQKLTDNRFTSTSDFKNKFTNIEYGVADFSRNLVTARGDGRGGLASGDLTAYDLTSDADLSGVKLFALNTDVSMVHNVYPEGYVVLTGGSTSVSGVKPNDFKPSVIQADYGDFTINGNLPSDGSGGMQGIEWDEAARTLTVTTNRDIEITLKEGVAASTGKIVLNGTGDVTLNGVNAASLDAKENTTVTSKGKNDIGTVTVDSGKNVVFQGGGQLKAGTFANNGAVSFNGGAVIVGDGTGTIGGTVSIDKASVAASITPSPASVKSIDVDWSKLTGLSDIASITFDGTKSTVPLGQSDKGTLWLDTANSHRITFTDSSGVSRTLAAKLNETTNQLEWGEPIKPFTVTGGVEGADYHYEDDGTTLVIDTNAVTSISGGKTADETGNALLGSIKLKDGIGNVNLELNGVDCSDHAAGSGLDLGEGNNVTLTLADGTENKFDGKNNCAGIAVGKGTQLTIDGNTGKLTAYGDGSSAGIGSNYDPTLTNPADAGNSVTIKGGYIDAFGGRNGAGIGGGAGTAFGDIVIEGGDILAQGGPGAAGIGGGNGGNNGKITIKGDITAYGGDKAAGIGGGTGGSCGDIVIESGTIFSDGGSGAAGIGSGNGGTNGDITINGGAITASSAGVGIGTGQEAQGGNILITGGRVNAEGGTGIGADQKGQMGTITISGGDITAAAGKNGAGIGAGGGSSCDDIEIKGGTVTATGAQDSTGIGAGRNSTCGAITIGDPADPDSKVAVTAQGGMTNNGGNIMSYSDPAHTEPGTIRIIGDNTTVSAGSKGEGLYSTSGVEDGNGQPRYSYPVYLFEADNPLDAGVGLVDESGVPLLPLDKDNVKLDSIKITSSTGDSWTPGMGDNNYAFVWLKPEDQTLTITYKENDGTEKTVELELVYHPDAGAFRTAEQPDPPPAQKPEYNDAPAPPGPSGPTGPTGPTDSPEPEKEGKGGIILQIGAEYGETLEVPQFYLSLEALGMGNLDISTQSNAWEAMSVIRNAINRVSSIRGTYGALYNRLEHNQNQLQHMIENITDAESRIRDVDVAEEMMRYTKVNILIQSSQAMLAQANQIPQGVLQMLN